MAAIEPYYCDDLVTIYHGDCREIVPTIGTVDMVVTDPPYGVDYDGGYNAPREKLAGDDGNVYAWCVPMIFDVCKGPAYLFYAGTRSLEVLTAVSKAKGKIHSIIVWHKFPAAYGAIWAQYKFAYEPILYCKGPKAKTYWCGSHKETSVWKMRRSHRNTYHPTQKPVPVVMRAINNHQCDLVLDPFMGAGSTLRAAKDLGRRAIGIDLNEKYCETAAKRMQQEALHYTSDGSIEEPVPT